MKKSCRIVFPILLVLAVFSFQSAHALDVVSSVTVTNPAPDYKDYFGTDVAQVGARTFVVGAPHEYSSSTSVPTAHLYDESGVLLLSVTNPTLADDDHFAYAVTGVGESMFVAGAFGDDSGNSDAGSVYLFSTNGTLLATVTNPTPASSDNFGVSVSGLGSSRFLVGANTANEVYIYDTSGALLATVTNPVPTGQDNFGYAIAELDAGGFIVGARYADEGLATNTGAAYVYDDNGILLLTVTNPTPEMSDYFGAAVCSLGDGHFAVGAPNDDTTTTNAGSVYVYDISGVLVTTISNPVNIVFANFGASISEVGDRRLLVGDPRGASYRTGSVWIYDLYGGLLAGVTNPLYGWDENYGTSVTAVDSNKFVVGVPYCRSGGSGIYHKSGYTYIYTFNDGRGFFVNDASTTDDAWCSAVGNDSNAGTNPAAPKASVQSVLATYDLEPRDTIYVDTGDYLMGSRIEFTADDVGSDQGYVDLVGSPTGVVIGMTVTDDYAILCNTADYIRVSGLTLTGGYNGVALRYSDHCQVTDVEISGTADDGVFTYFSDGNLFKGLEIAQCGGAGLYWAVESDNNLLANSIVWSNAEYGVRSEGSLGVGYTRSNLVVRSTLALNGSHQVYVANSSSIQMRDSITVASGTDICCIYQQSTYKGGYGFYQGDYNNLYTINDGRVGAYDTWDPPPPFVNPTYYTNLVDWQGANKDTNSISSDPLFVDNGGDFHLRSSAASGTYVVVTGGWTNFPGDDSAGIDTGDPASDYAGEPQWNGGIINLGAYGGAEFASRSVDTDNDTLSDTFETYQFGTEADDDDSDDDGMGDGHERTAGTDATSGDSVFAATCDGGLAASQEKFVLQWPSAEGRQYRVEKAATPMSGFSPIASGINATPPMNSWTTSVSGVDQAVYKVHVSQ